MENITLNGKPVKDFIDQQIGSEIFEVRSSDERVRVNRAISTRNRRNSSGARTLPGVVVYQADQREMYIGILGEIFSWQDKAPFERSGHSVMGAVEMDKDYLVKCHQCGTWHRDISTHISAMRRNNSSTHTTIKEYRIRHGLLSTYLAHPEVTEKRRRLGLRRGIINNLPEQIDRNHSLARETRKTMKAANVPRWSQSFNLVGACRAQTLKDLQCLAKELGRTPSKIELSEFINAHGRHTLVPQRLRRIFGVSVASVFLQAGLNPRKNGSNIKRGGYSEDRLRRMSESMKITLSKKDPAIMSAASLKAWETRRENSQI